MLSRRQFMTLTPSLIGLCAVGRLTFASNVPLLMSDAELERQMLSKLTTELNDATLAKTETQYLMSTLFNWVAPTIETKSIQTIVAYSFGYRASLDPLAMPEAGPINEQIADAVYILYQMTQAPIYAQWEVATVLKAKYHLDSTKVITVGTPKVTSTGVTVATLDEVISAILLKAGSAKALGHVAVVTHRDQQALAVDISKAKGLQAAAPADIKMPMEYDVLCLPKNNRKRNWYILTSVATRLGMLRMQLITEQYPNG